MAPTFSTEKVISRNIKCVVLQAIPDLDEMDVSHTFDCRIERDKVMDKTIVDSHSTILILSSMIELNVSVNLYLEINVLLIATGHGSFKWTKHMYFS